MPMRQGSSWLTNKTSDAYFLNSETKKWEKQTDDLQPGSFLAGNFTSTKGSSFASALTSPVSDLFNDRAPHVIAKGALVASGNPKFAAAADWLEHRLENIAPNNQRYQAFLEQGPLGLLTGKRIFD